MVDSQFVLDMIACGELSESTDTELQPGTFVLYFYDGELRHAGVIEEPSSEPLVRSKWGGNELYRHKLWEVPACHGDSVRFFGTPNPEVVLARLKDELEEN